MSKPIKLPKPRTELSLLLQAKRHSSAMGEHKPRSVRQKRKATFQKLLNKGYYE